MRKTVRIFTMLSAMVAMSAPGFAIESPTMRCDGGIVSVGDRAVEVLGKCGQPSYSTQREEKRINEGGRGSREKTVAIVTIDDWSYNFGPNQFQYRLLLEDGKVTRIESLDYGY